MIWLGKGHCYPVLAWHRSYRMVARGEVGGNQQCHTGVTGWW